MSDTNIQSFLNPYANIQAGEGNRITMDVSRADYLLIKLIRPGSGTISGVMGLLWSKLCHELKQRNITSINECQPFERFVASSRLISADEYADYCRLKQLGLSDRPASRPEASGNPTQASGGNDRGRAKGVRRNASRGTEQRGDIPSQGPSTGSGEGTSQGG